MSQQAQQLIAQAKAEGWKRLELGKCGLTDLETQVPELFDLTDLEELVLSNRWWDSDKDKQDWWACSANEGEDNYLCQLPPAMAKLTQLKVLICCGDGIDDNWAISDYSVVQYLPHLTSLDLRWNQIKRIENLDKLPNLQYLDLGWNQIKRIENLDKLPNLQYLDLGDNQIKRIENLDGLPNLQQLYLNDNKITKLENLHKLPNLQHLNISYNQIANEEYLAHAGLPATCKVFL